eukprot:s2488_g12.t1
MYAGEVKEAVVAETSEPGLGSNCPAGDWAVQNGSHCVLRWSEEAALVLTMAVVVAAEPAVIAFLALARTSGIGCAAAIGKKADEALPSPRKKADEALPSPRGEVKRNQNILKAENLDRNGDGRRRSERNFSDLFGQSSGRPLPLSTAGRSEFHATATASWMDSTTETSARNHERRAGLAESGSLVFDPSAQSMEKILPLSPRGAAPRRSPDWFEERTCWDFSPQNAMHIGVELARRSREGPARRVQSLDAGRPGRGNIAPAERKQANLASRLTGASQPTAAGTPKGRARSAIADSPSMVRSGDLSPAARSALSLLTPNSARERKFKELHSSAKLI